jgi:hypothetical protein
MPKGKRDYSNIIFYKIYCKDKSVIDIYIGKTNDFSNRKSVHKSDCNSGKKNHLILYKTITENKGWDNWKMKEIEKGSFNSEWETRLREDELCIEYKATLNKNKPIVKDLNGEILILTEDLSKKERGLMNSAFRNKVLLEKANMYDDCKIIIDQLKEENEKIKEELKQFNFYKEENRLLKELFKNSLNNC